MSVSPSLTGRKPSAGRRLRRALLLAVFVGAVSFGLSMGGALFVQGAFGGLVQPCENEVAADRIASEGAQPGDCAGTPQVSAEWLPLTMVASGGSAGVIGGFVYGMFADRHRARRPTLQSHHLPF
ncbi:MAG: hypothetical protein FJ318_01815 [SAR202 cluster bacterium]|nr:hypothetical protein [SAR202 cluster bacterium]